jgi:hypothetical protein
MLVVLGVIVAMMAAPPHQGASAPSAWLIQDGTPSAITTLTFAPVADAQVAADNPDFRYGTKTELLVKGGTASEVASYLRFDVSGVSAPVQRATLRLWVRDKGGSQDGPAVYATDAAWTETDLTWNTRPAPRGDVLADTGKVASNTWAEYDVTAAVSGDGPIAFVLVAQSADGAIFHSREAANPPQLVILVGDEAPTPTPAPRTAPAPGADPVLLAAGDIADCDSDGDEATAKLLDGLSGTVAALGDTVYESGTPQQFADCYDPTWGRHKRRTRPAVGNHEYLTSGAAGYFGYFGAAAGDPAKGYYSYDLGSWHVVVLNSNCTPVGGCGAGSPQETWLRQDLAAHPTKCTLAYWHHPLFNFGEHGNDLNVQALWQALYEAGAEIVLSGHDHNYQRWTPQTPSGTQDDARGIREFVVGTGGKNHYALGAPPPNVEASNDETFGILQLTLHPDSYDWQFLPIAGQSFTDTGSGACH